MAFDGDACRVDDDSGAVGCFGPAHTHKETAAHRLALRERVDLLQI